jgi:hypothetical protein
MADASLSQAPLCVLPYSCAHALTLFIEEYRSSTVLKPRQHIDVANLEGLCEVLQGYGESYRHGVDYLKQLALLSVVRYPTPPDFEWLRMGRRKFKIDQASQPTQEISSSVIPMQMQVSIKKGARRRWEARDMD